ncbi:MAG: signal peptidase I [Oscillatoriales cyanobacterium C42_A2020_001]|nr:signal peptidase I [Leptolyngbyaceae cyanobacterium C42_A2020_001]
MSPSNSSSAKPNIFLWLAAGLGILSIAAFVALRLALEARYIPSKAMEPTLKVGDRILINKLAYLSTDPQRGDVVTFIATEEASVICGGATESSSRTNNVYIKRIVGLPGEKVEIRNQQVLINGQPIQESYILEKPDYQYGPQSVPANSYFVLGDSRNNSCDSHYWGFVPRANMMGKAVWRYLPPDRSGVI